VAASPPANSACFAAAVSLFRAVEVSPKESPAQAFRPRGPLSPLHRLSSCDEDSSIPQAGAYLREGERLSSVFPPLALGSLAAFFCDWLDTANANYPRALHVNAGSSCPGPRVPAVRSAPPLSPDRAEWGASPGTVGLCRVSTLRAL
jgi:hypothetical protein